MACLSVASFVFAFSSSHNAHSNLFMCSSTLTHQIVSPSHPPHHVSLPSSLVNIMGLGSNTCCLRLDSYTHTYPYFMIKHDAICHNRIHEYIYPFRGTSYRVNGYEYKIAKASDVLHSQDMSPTHPPELGSRALQRHAPCHLAACSLRAHSDANQV